MNSGERQSIARNSGSTIVSQSIINIASIFVVGYIATRLGDADYGKYVFAFAFVQTFSSLSNMGIHVVQVREIAKNKEEAPAFFGATLIFRVFFAALTYLLIAVVISVLNYPEVTKKVVYIAGLTLIFLYISDTCIATFRGYERMDYSAAINMGTTLFSIALRTVVIYCGYRLIVLSWTTALVGLITAGISYYFVHRDFFVPRLKLTVGMFRSIFLLTLPFYSMHVFMEAYKRIDVVLLSFFVGDAEVGWYNAASTLILQLAFVPSALSGAIFPVMSRLVAGGRRAKAEKVYRDGFFILLVLASVVAIGVHFFAKIIILTVYDEGFEQSIEVLRLLSLTIPMTYLTFHMQNALFSLGKEVVVTKIIGVYTLINVLLNLALIPRYGCVGAAYSGCIAQMVNFCLNWYIFAHHLKIKSIDTRSIRVLIVSGITIVILVVVRPVGFFLTLAVSSISFTFLLAVFGLLRRRTLIELQEVLLEGE